MEKLIRDKLHLIPHPAYPNMQTRRVRNVEEHIAFLVAKIQEEHIEFEQARDPRRQMHEAGDILEVYDSLIDVYAHVNSLSARERMIHFREEFLLILDKRELPYDIIRKIQNQIRREKGGFEKGIIWIYE